MLQPTHFRIGGEERDYLLVEVLARERPQSYDASDGNWLQSNIHVQAGAWTGSYRAALRSEDFVRFLGSLQQVMFSFESAIFTSFAEFATDEEHLSITVRADALGRFSAQCVAVDDAGIGNRLEFELAFDQTSLPAIVSGLETIIEAFPVRGNRSD